MFEKPYLVSVLYETLKPFRIIIIFGINYITLLVSVLYDYTILYLKKIVLKKEIIKKDTEKVGIWYKH